MDINQTDLFFIDPAELTIVHQQSIPAIRVWGVGRDNAKFVHSSIEPFDNIVFHSLCRDFAYVAKDKDRSMNIFKCHVFRCENTTARVIADTLRDVCRNLMVERGLLTMPSVDCTANPMSQRSTSFPESISHETKNSTKIIWILRIAEKTDLCVHLF